jgi:two-component system CheB/CheR fusion protein
MTTTPISEPIPPNASTPFPIVGIVASAGGLAAFKEFLSNVAADSGLAYVLVPHLDPTFASQMVPLLSKVCSLPVVEAAQGMVAEANHVYVIPAQYFLGIAEGIFQLSEPPALQGSEIAIDFFLRSLAKDQGEHSIGIVLSGTGTHGTLGIRDIKLAGGLAIAQSPATSEFDAMPSSIIGEGLADSILPPAEMPAMLAQYTQQPYIKQPGFLESEASIEDKQVQTILALLRKHAHYDFSSYRTNMMLRRIQRRMGLLRIEHLDEYITRLTEDPKEAIALYRDLLISVTVFFRNPEVYDALADKLREELSNRAGARFPFRVWVPGCATGEEAYSIAMLLHECLDKQSDRDLGENPPTTLILVFATDVDEDAIERARTGIYPLSIASDVSQERLNRFFTQTDAGQYRIGKQLRSSIVFSRQNVLTDAPFSKLDFVSCRNLLIYWKPEMQQRVISLFHFSLADQGILLLGPSESISRAEDLFEPISKKLRLFQKLPSARSSSLAIPLVTPPPLLRSQLMESPTISVSQRYKKLVDRSLISAYAPASVLVNRYYDVLYQTGPLVDFLEFPTGEPNHNLLAMSRAGLRTKLRTVCQKSIAETVDQTIDAQVKRGDELFECEISVRLVQTPSDAENLLLVSFTEKSAAASNPGQVSASASPEATASTKFEQEQREIKSNNDEFESMIEELGGAIEDLKTSNEEIMSMNEELQSANEELESSREELQSLNEEHRKMNSELLEQATELDDANNDILNLIASTEMAAVFLDRELLIQRFTPPIVAFLNVRNSDIGRPLADITMRFVDDNLLSDCQKVVEEGIPIQTEIDGEKERLFLRRILPYRSQGDQVVGVVITFVDLTDRLVLEKSLKQNKDHLQAILDSAEDAILTIDDQGIIVSLNPATERLFGYYRDDIIGKSILALLTSADFEGSLEESIIQYFPISDVGGGRYHEQTAKRKDGSSFAAEFTRSRIDHLSLYIVLIRDVSQRKELQSKILEIASDEQRRIGQELHDGTQQELTGLSLIAGTLEDFFNQRIQGVADGSQTMTLERDELARLKLTATKLVEGLNEANQHVQSLSHGIMPVQIDGQGLRSALTELANMTSMNGKVVCRFSHVGTLTPDSNSVATHLYRIAQEAINNALRHGAAEVIDVSLTTDADHIQLEIRDDGIGIKAAPRDLSGSVNHGVGLQIMKHRASVMGGFLSILPGKERGTVICCNVPKRKKIG